MSTLPAGSVMMLEGVLLVSPTKFTATTVTVMLLNFSTPDGPIMRDVSLPGTERVTFDVMASHCNIVVIWILYTSAPGDRAQEMEIS